MRPADICRALLAALEASEARSKKRKRDQTPDTIGLAVKRDILAAAVHEDPDPECFEAWLLRYADRGASPGAAFALARAVLEEWRLAHRMGEVAAGLACGAPSADADAENGSRRLLPRS